MRILIALFLCLVHCYSNGQNYKIDTLEYYSYENQLLTLDVYQNNSSEVLKPTILFVHGGSFMHGNKNSPYILPYAEHWLNEGFNFVAINYRLTLKGQTFHCKCPSEKKVETFEHAVYDIRAATSFLQKHSKELNIDSEKIILAGNSAGAEAVLHTAYWKNSEHNIGKALLSDNFRYAGVLAYAGAIIDTNLINKENAIPTALFHGTCDKYVPYMTAPHHYCDPSTPGALVLSGSYDIAQRLKNLDQSYLLYTLINGKHKVNTLGMDLPIKETIAFVHKTILQNEKKQQHEVEISADPSCNYVTIDLCE